MRQARCEPAVLRGSCCSSRPRVRPGPRARCSRSAARTDRRRASNRSFRLRRGSGPRRGRSSIVTRMPRWHTGLAGAMLALVVASGPAWAQERVTLRSDVLFYGDNTEFRNPFREARRSSARRLASPSSPTSPIGSGCRLEHSATSGSAGMMPSSSCGRSLRSKSMAAARRLSSMRCRVTLASVPIEPDLTACCRQSSARRSPSIGRARPDCSGISADRGCGTRCG